MKVVVYQIGPGGTMLRDSIRQRHGKWPQSGGAEAPHGRLKAGCKHDCLPHERPVLFGGTCFIQLVQSVASAARKCRATARRQAKACPTNAARKMYKLQGGAEAPHRLKPAPLDCHPNPRDSIALAALSRWSYAEIGGRI